MVVSLTVLDYSGPTNTGCWPSDHLSPKEENSRCGDLHGKEKVNGFFQPFSVRSIPICPSDRHFINILTSFDGVTSAQAKEFLLKIELLKSILFKQAPWPELDLYWVCKHKDLIPYFSNVYQKEHINFVAWSGACLGVTGLGWVCHFIILLCGTIECSM